MPTVSTHTPDATDTTDPRDLLAEAPDLRRAVLAWYDVEGRVLPFRGTTDAWAILVSEAMAQQTQAVRAGETWQRFMARFPTPATLADASPAEVLRAWRGLGYNRRAVNLQRAAAEIVERHHGAVPSDLAELEALPGVGPYTARAVAALAFGAPVGAVDTNVRRVLSRLTATTPDARSPRHLQRLADSLVDPLRPGDWTHAVMDIGARLCRARRIDCPACPLQPWCRTASVGLDERPRATTTATRAVRERQPAFPSSSRWLRGRIIERLRDASDGEWVRFDGPVGDHPVETVGAALDALTSEGLIERPADEALVARLPTRRPPERPQDGPPATLSVR
jgi:A/G-specific adenine glycosylase